MVCGKRVQDDLTSAYVDALRETGIGYERRIDPEIGESLDDWERRVGQRDRGGPRRRRGWIRHRGVQHPFGL
jgi:hypothetical protein